MDAGTVSVVEERMSALLDGLHPWCSVPLEPSGPVLDMSGSRRPPAQRSGEVPPSDGPLSSLPRTPGADVPADGVPASAPAAPDAVSGSAPDGAAAGGAAAGGAAAGGAAAGGAAAGGAAAVEACLEGVHDERALAWAASRPGPGLLAELTGLRDALVTDLPAACAPQSEPAPAPAVSQPPQISDVSDAVLVEAIAAAERCMTHLAALRDVVVGVFAAHRQTEAEADVAAASAADGVGRPWAQQVRSTAPTELAARLGTTERAAADLLDRGTAALSTHAPVNAAMASGLLPAQLGTWLLDELVELHATTRATAETAEHQRWTAARAALRAAEDGARELEGAAALGAGELTDRARADAAQVDADAAAAATAHADAVVAQVRAAMLTRATGSPDGLPAPDPSDDAPRLPRPAGLGPSRASWKRHLTRAVHAADPTGAAARAEAARTQRSVRRWGEADGQACLQLRGPAEDVALIGAAMDARAQRRLTDARTAERAAAKEGGRRYDRTAVGTLDAHRFEAVKEWAVAALELAGTSGASGTWYPVARTAASRPVVNLTLPVTLPLGITPVGAFLSGYGALGAAAAMRLADDGLWRRIFTDPVSGAAVGVDEGTYRPGTSLRRLVQLRHATSTMPGSTRPSADCDIDHLQPWRDDGTGGATTATNLHPLARYEHLLKQAGEHGPPGHGWRVDPGHQDEGGVAWRAPTGHTHRVLPDVLDEGLPALRSPGGWPYTDPGSSGPDWSTAAFTDAPPPADPPPDAPDDDGWLPLFDELPDS